MSNTQFIEQNIVRVPWSGCWIWTKAAHGGGHGVVWKNNKSNLAHRFVYAELVGEIPDGLRVLHRCDVKTCVNPAHLYLGTDLDNMNDQYARGRRTLRCYRKLSKRDCFAISVLRRFGVSGIKLAKIYGVDNTSIYSAARKEK